MKKNHLYILILLICVSLAACNSGTKETVADAKPSTAGFDLQKAKAFIDSINLKFTDEFRRGDSAALAAHYSDDAEMLFANSEPIKGKGILSAWGSMVRGGLKDFTFVTTDITGSSDLIVETGNYEMRTEDKVLVERGKYVVVWKLVNGEWKLFRDIGNTSMPATAAKK